MFLSHSYRCQALLCLRMFKMYKREVKEYNKILQDYQNQKVVFSSDLLIIFHYIINIYIYFFFCVISNRVVWTQLIRSVQFHHFPQRRVRQDLSDPSDLQGQVVVVMDQVLLVHLQPHHITRRVQHQRQLLPS